MVIMKRNVAILIVCIVITLTTMAHQKVLIGKCDDIARSVGIGKHRYSRVILQSPSGRRGVFLMVVYEYETESPSQPFVVISLTGEIIQNEL